MAIGKQVVETLRRLAAEGPEAVATLAWSEDARAIMVEDATARVRIELAEHDRFSVTLRELEVRTHAPQAADAPQEWLSAHAAEAARRLSFLEEPLAVWELDAGERTVQLRSSPPERDGEAVTYWEVALRLAEHPGATIARHHWAPGMVERAPVDYPAAFPLAGRIAEALAAALDEPDAVTR